MIIGEKAIIGPGAKLFVKKELTDEWDMMASISNKNHMSKFPDTWQLNDETEEKWMVVKVEDNSEEFNIIKALL